MRKSQRLVAALLCVAVLQACSASALKTQYRTIGSVTTSVDLGMKAWASYVNAGKSTADQQAKVRDAYRAYQNAAQVARTAYKLGDGSASPTDLSMAAGALIGLIEAFSGKPVPKPEVTP